MEPTSRSRPCWVLLTSSGELGVRDAKISSAFEALEEVEGSQAADEAECQLPSIRTDGDPPQGGGAARLDRRDGSSLELPPRRDLHPDQRGLGGRSLRGPAEPQLALAGPSAREHAGADAPDRGCRAVARRDHQDLSFRVDAGDRTPRRGDAEEPSGGHGSLGDQAGLRILSTEHEESMGRRRGSPGDDQNSMTVWEPAGRPDFKISEIETARLSWTGGNGLEATSIPAPDQSPASIR